MDMRFTDIHCHIIPCVDDGSADMETSLHMIDMAYDEGIRRMIATPHFGIINPHYDPNTVDKNFSILCKKVAEKYTDLKLYLGNEIFIAPGYSDGLLDGMSNSLAGSSYVLVEFATDADYDMLYYELRRIMLKGYIPILAHAERYVYAYKNIKGLKSIKDQGVLIQINSNSIIRCSKKTGGIKKVLSKISASEKHNQLIKDMLISGLVDFVGTDCHDMPGRQPRMKAAAEIMIDLIGEEKTRKILVDNPDMLIGEE